MKHIDGVGTDLVPGEAVVVDVPEEDLPLDAAVQAARNGDWAPASWLLDQTRNGPDWDMRDNQVETLAHAALADSRWIMSWLDRSPEDPNALLLRGALFINRAWEQRGGRLGKETTSEQFEGFFHYLGLAEPALRAAIAANPADPTPWAHLISYAMGCEEDDGPAVFDQAWSAVRGRAPHHRLGHERALQYHCDKWRGSDEQMFEFAYRSADAAPRDSALQLLPMWAWLEHMLRLSRGTISGDALGSPAAHEAVTRALTVCPAYGPATYRWSRGDRNTIALLLWLQERFEEALDQFRAIGPYATSDPWEGIGDGDARQNFLDVREAVRVEVAVRLGSRS